jgi:hypothetical protein
MMIGWLRLRILMRFWNKLSNDERTGSHLTKAEFLSAIEPLNVSATDLEYKNPG